MKKKFILRKTPYGNMEIDFYESGGHCITENGSFLNYYGNGIIEIVTKHSDNFCETLAELLSINTGLEIGALTGPHISNQYGGTGIIAVFRYRTDKH